MSRQTSLGKCEICGKIGVVYTCAICKRKVCPEEYIADKGICEICDSSLCQICGKFLSIAICNACGKLGCEECLVKRGAGYICKLCLKRETHENTSKNNCRLTRSGPRSGNS